MISDLKEDGSLGVNKNGERVLRKNIIGKLSLILSLIILISLLNFVKSAGADISNKPSFDIEIGTDSNSFIIGEDIVVRGNIIPQSFETEVLAKEIVLVLDTSGSMDTYIYPNIRCSEKEQRCIKHNKEKNHKMTKLDQLKDAVTSFIETMKNVPNLKIGIVEYSTLATINPNELNKPNLKKEISYIFGSHSVMNYKTLGVDLLDVKDSKLNDIIATINPLGGTNTGEGLRKAIQILNSGKSNANKTIVLMTDGLPTFYSVIENYKYDKTNQSKNFYLEVDALNPKTAGKGSGLDDNAKDYAQHMAKLVKKNGYSAYSVGYGMDKQGNAILKDIHESMIGTELGDNEADNENNGYYKTSDNIIGIFNNIATDIIDSYHLNNVNLEIDFEDGFSMNIDDNKVDLRSITYKNNKDLSTNTKIRYEAEKIPFSFIVKATKEGYQKINSNMSINYQFNNEILNQSLDENIYVNIKSNELPNIQAELLTEKNITVKENEEITLEYEIKPESFSFNDETNVVKNDVVFVIDVSKDMSIYMNPLINDIWNDILNNEKLKSAETEYDIITFSNKVKQVVDLNLANYERYDQYITDLNDNYIKNILKADNLNAKNIKETYGDIVKLLENGRQGARKNVIFISVTSNISYGSEKDYGKLKGKGYNIITVELENKNNGNNKNDLKDFHKILNGKEENYFYTNDQNDLQNNILSKVANSIISNLSYNDYTFIPKLQIDLNENFDLVNGAEKTDNNTVIINVPKIIYKYSESNNIYEAKEFSVKFTIKPKTKKIGVLNFGNENKLIYKKLIKNEDKYSLVKTPTIIVKAQIKELVHGLYSGIIDNELVIEKSSDENGFMLSAGSMVTFAASFKGNGSEFDLNLNLDNKIEVKNEEIKVYKLINNGDTKQLVELSRKITPLEENLISINAINSDNTNVETEFVVIYKGKIREESINSDFINEIRISDLKAEVKFNTPNIENPNEDYMNILPDLF